MTTKEEAAEIAERYIARGRYSGYAVNHVCDLFGIRFAPPRIYNLKLDDRCWVVYLRGPEYGTVLKSSDIVVVSKDTGDVLYCGGAGDEG